jgi:hypothetical protein
MKRSKVIEKLAEVLEFNFDFDNGSWDRDAQAILEYLESIGMKPPRDAVTLLHKWDHE